MIALTKCNKCENNVEESQVRKFEGITYCTRCWVVFVKTNPKYASFYR